MKKFKLIALTALLAMGTNAFAAAVVDETGRSVDGIVYQLSTDGDNKTAKVLGIDLNVTDANCATITIPATVTGANGTYKVNEFAEDWENVASATGYKAAAALVTSLSIDMTNFVQAQITKDVFNGFTKLETLTITDTATRADAAKLTFPSESDTKSALDASKATLKSVSLPTNFTTLAASAFNGCAKLESFDLTNITSIGKSAFEGCATITSLTIPAGVTAVGDDAFKGMTELATVAINISNETLTTVGAWFANDSKIESITITSAKLTEIAASAFTSTVVKTIDLSAATKLATVNANSFAKSTKLETVKLAGTELTALTGFDFSDSKKTLTTVTLPAKLTGVPTSQFEGCTALTSITLPTADTFTTIGASAFKGCTGLTTIAIPAKVTTIPASCFEGCTALASITGMAGVTTLTTDAFKGCTALAAIAMPEVTSLDIADLFKDCVLTKLEAPKATAINADLFGTGSATRAANTILTEVVLGAASIPQWTFANCTALKKATVVPIGTAADEIALQSFYGCTALTEFGYEPKAALTAAGSVNKDAFNACTAFILFTTNQYYTAQNPAAPNNCKFSAGVSTVVKTTLDKGGSGLYFAKLLIPVGKEYRISVVDGVKIYTCYVDETNGNVCLQAARPRDIAGTSTWVLKADKTSSSDAHVIIKSYEEVELSYADLTAVPAQDASLYDDDVVDMAADMTRAEFEIANVNAGEYIYALTNSAATGGWGFTYYTGANMPKSAFFVVSPLTPAAAAGRLNMIWLDENGNIESETTAINRVENVANDGVIYNMAGQKVDANYKGIVIKNGKKMIQK